MARIRTIKPSFFTSEVVAELPLRARLTWIGLWTHCDDQGRCKDNARLIKAAVWPLDDVTLRDVDDDLDSLTGQGLVLRYQVEGKCYIQITNWTEHQKINRPSNSDLPGPLVGPEHPDEPHGVLTESSVTVPGVNGTAPAVKSITSQVKALTEDSVSLPGLDTEGSSPERKGRERKNPSPSSARGVERFDEFYAAYPRHVDRQDAVKAWTKAIKVHPAESIIRAAESYAVAQRGKEPNFTKYPSTWLNKKCYLDEPETHALRLVAGDPPGIHRDPKTGRLVEW